MKIAEARRCEKASELLLEKLAGADAEIKAVGKEFRRELKELERESKKAVERACAAYTKLITQLDGQFNKWEKLISELDEDDELSGESFMPVSPTEIIVMDSFDASAVIEASLFVEGFDGVLEALDPDDVLSELVEISMLVEVRRKNAEAYEEPEEDEDLDGDEE
jgi:hypothetical protein